MKRTFTVSIPQGGSNAGLVIPLPPGFAFTLYGGTFTCNPPPGTDPTSGRQNPIDVFVWSNVRDDPSSLVLAQTGVPAIDSTGIVLATYATFTQTINVAPPQPVEVPLGSTLLGSLGFPRGRIAGIPDPAVTLALFFDQQRSTFPGRVA